MDYEPGHDNDHAFDNYDQWKTSEPDDDGGPVDLGVLNPPGDGSHWGLIDLYPDWEKRLKEAFDSGNAFQAHWSSKKEIVTAKLERDLDGTLRLGAYVSCDEGLDLVGDALWTIFKDLNPDANGGEDYDVWLASRAHEVGEDPSAPDFDLAEWCMDQLDMDESAIWGDLQYGEPSFIAETEMPAEATWEEVLSKIDDLWDEAEDMNKENYALLQDYIRGYLKLTD